MHAHIPMNELPYTSEVHTWLKARYGEAADGILCRMEEVYAGYLEDLPDYGGRKNGHAYAIYGGLLVFALYESLPDRPPYEELQDFVQHMFMAPFTKLGRVFNLNRSLDLRLIDLVFRRSGDRDRRDIVKYPAGFINVDAPYDKEHHAARYAFTQCPNADFAKSHGLLHVLPLLCNCDYFGISEIHGTLIRTGTCGNSDVCDYCVVGDRNPLAEAYEIITDEQGFLVSRKKEEHGEETVCTGE